jgi:hypothetical protein
MTQQATVSNSIRTVSKLMLSKETLSELAGSERGETRDAARNPTGVHHSCAFGCTFSCHKRCF